jgi:hypothetical protein
MRRTTVPRPRKETSVYIAKEGFTCELDGVEVRVASGERVRAGHPLLRAYAEHFEAADSHLTYDHQPPEVEQATAAPGELRGQ